VEYLLDLFSQFDFLTFMRFHSFKCSDICSLRARLTMCCVKIHRIDSDEKKTKHIIQTKAVYPIKTKHAAL